jgi:hypothetical protein
MLTNTRQEDETPTETAPRGIALDIAGGDLMLRGRFNVWQSGFWSGPDLDRVGIRLAIDATSAGAQAQVAEPLFSFHSRSVEAKNSGEHVARGTFSGSQGSRPLELVIETPPGHTALFVLSFAADRRDFGDGWGEVLANQGAGDQEGSEPVRAAHGWLTTPVLAAA